MQIDQSHIQRELENIRMQHMQAVAQQQAANAQAEQAANVIQQAIGAEKAFNSMLTMLATPEVDVEATRAAEPETETPEGEAK